MVMESSQGEKLDIEDVKRQDSEGDRFWVGSNFWVLVEIVLTLQKKVIYSQMSGITEDGN